MKTWGLLVTALLLCCGWIISAEEAALHRIDPAKDIIGCVPNAISADGTTVVGQLYLESQGREAFRWNPTNQMNPFRVLMPRQQGNVLPSPPTQ